MDDKIKIFRTLTASIILMALLISSYVVSSQSSKNSSKLTSNGYWIHPKVEEIPGLKTGPFVRFGNGDILTVEGNKSCISNHEGKTWTEYPIFADSNRFDIRIERALTRTRNGVIISSEVAHSNNREELSVMFSDDDGKTWTKPVAIAKVTDKSKIKNLAYPLVFEAKPGEIWITTTYAGFAGELSIKLLEKDFLN